MAHELDEPRNASGLGDGALVSQRDTGQHLCALRVDPVAGVAQERDERRDATRFGDRDLVVDVAPREAGERLPGIQLPAGLSR